MRRRTAVTVSAAAVGGATAGWLAARRAAQEAHAVATSTAWPEPVEGRTRRVTAEDGVSLHVEEHGAERPALTVVLSHGWVQSSRLWAGTVRDLLDARDDLKVVVYDHRGHGQSDPTSRERATLEQLGRDLRAVVDAVAPAGPVVLGGHSMGGMTLLAFAEQYPRFVRERLAGVAFFGTSSGELGEVTWGLPAPVARAVRRGLPAAMALGVYSEQRGWPRANTAFAERYLNFARGADLALVRGVLEVERATPMTTFAYFPQTMDEHDRAHALELLSHVPALVVVGDKDRLCPVPHSEKLAAGLPNARLVVYPGVGHLPHLDRRQAVSQRLLELVDDALAAQDAEQAS